ncbi:hypothetical protein [Thalassoglobus neptunius]|uniref:hypothetical protein n=1 Tax=Thalassoglobus neptunius TaxID=1938619 RepID=UPI0018D2190B|nr:hypothetical protein [Thalassoglobus neptunius]
MLNLLMTGLMGHSRNRRNRDWPGIVGDCMRPQVDAPWFAHEPFAPAILAMLLGPM